MAKRTRRRAPFVRLVDLLADQHPDVEDPEELVLAGAVEVNGAIMLNTDAMVRRDAAIRLKPSKSLRGSAKLAAALDQFAVPVEGRAALDLGASTGGFTSVLVEQGARIVYAVDVGHGQLLGSLRQNERVRNLERTNLGQLNTDLVPDVIDVVTLDLSYLSLGEAVAQVETVNFAADADLIALIKPVYELGLGDLPTTEDELEKAVELAVSGLERSPWKVDGVIRSPVRGGKGAIEFLARARRRSV